MPSTRKKCLKLLYRTCGHYALLPRVLKIPICYDRTGVALYRGGFADVWKGEHCGRDVAVKVIRTYSNSDLQKIIGVGRWLCFLCASLCPNSAHVEVLQGSCDVENPPASECPATDRSDDDRNPIHDGVGLDGKWKRQRLRESTSRCKPVGVGGLFTHLSSFQAH